MTYEYDDEGRLARAVSETEPEWTDDDRAALRALLEEEATTCRGCGNRLDECMDPSTQGTWTVHKRVCEACRVRDAVMEGDAENPTRGTKYSVRRTDLTANGPNGSG